VAKLFAHLLHRTPSPGYNGALSIIDVLTLNFKPCPVLTLDRAGANLRQSAQRRQTLRPSHPPNRPPLGHQSALSILDVLTLNFEQAPVLTLSKAVTNLRQAPQRRQTLRPPDSLRRPPLLYHGALALGLYPILQLPIVCDIYCNNGGSGGNITLCNSAGDDGVGVGYLNKGWVRKE